MTTPPPDTFCPYKGLQPYTEADRKYFFGRARDQGIIVSNLFAASLTVFYGASGVGKSSVLLAGAVPRLKQEPGTTVVVVFNKWQSAEFLTELKTEIAIQAGAENPPDMALPLDEFLIQTQRAVGLPILLIFDQFEEYFLYHPPSPAADAFEGAFARAVNRRNTRINFLLSMREDGLSKLDRFQGRIPTLLNNLVRLEHLDRKAAEEAIARPLDEYNVEMGAGQPPMSIEPGLVKAVLDDLVAARVTPEQAGQGQVGASQRAPAMPIETPFLQVVMTRLWEEERAKNSHLLCLQTYDSMGRALNIARTHLDNMMAKLTEPQRETAASLMRYLVTPSGSKIAQEAGALSSWSEVPPAEVETLLNRLNAPDMRILKTVQTPGQPLRYEIFHDVLAPAILDWRGRYVQEQKRLEAEKQLAAQERKAARARWIAVGSLLLLILMVVLAYKAYQAKFTAHSHELAAYSRSQLDTDPELGLLLALEAVTAKKTEHSLSALRSALLESQVSAVVGAKRGGRVAGVAFSPDGKYVATASWDSKANIWDAVSGAVVTTLPGHKGHVNSVSFSSDGKYVLTAAEDGTARVWEAWQTATPKLITTLKEAYEIVTADFSRDGAWIRTAGGEGKVRVWEWRTDPQTPKAELTVAEALVEPPRPVPEGANPLAMETGNTVQAAEPTLAMPSDATPTPTPVVTASSGRGTLIFKAQFSPNGKSIIIAAKHRRGLIWNWSEGTSSVIRLSGHAFALYDVAFSGNGEYAITGSDDATAMIWELKKEGPPTMRVKLSLVPHRIRGVAFSADARFVATASYDGLARIWEWRLWEPKLREKQKPEERSQPTVLRGDSGLLMCAAFSPDGKSLITGSDDGTARIWRTQKLSADQINNLSDDELVKLAHQRVTRDLSPQERQKYTSQ